MQIILNENEVKQLVKEADEHNINEHDLLDRYIEIVEANFGVNLEDAVEASV